MVLALVLSIMSSRAQQPQSVIQVQTPAATTAPAPVLPGLGDAPAGEGEAPAEGAPGDPGP
jgi:hypothetical protein